MSQIALSPPAGGTGVFTIAAPATNTNRTLTILDADGTVATSASTLAQFNASGSAPVFACRAWVNFNGTGTVAIRAAGNVGSITDVGVGDFIVNFTTAMPDTNFKTDYSIDNTSGGSALVHPLVVPPTATTAVRIICIQNGGGNPGDPIYNNVGVFR